uniref:Uncharacterized protein n=1 Tax=Anolis carolinensis TaxID=28377 RepID=A0A803SX56_ANOCA
VAACGQIQKGIGPKFRPHTRLLVGAGALAFFFVLCWLYIFPTHRLPGEKEIVRGVRLQQKGKAWRRDPHTAHAFRSGANSSQTPTHLSPSSQSPTSPSLPFLLLLLQPLFSSPISFFLSSPLSLSSFFPLL